MSSTPTTDDRPVRYDVEDRIARITLDRPDSLNAVTPELYEGIEAGLEQAAADDARVVVIQGEGRAFCVGADMEQHDERERSAKERREYVWRAQDACRAVQTSDLPVIASVHGYAIGAGAELALSADFLVMSEDAEIRFPEVSIGTYVGGGVSYTLSARVGAAKAKELVLRGATVTGAEADEMGLASEVVPRADLEDEVDELADDLAGNAPIPMAFAKEQFDPARQADRDHRLTAEAEALLACMGTDDWQEGVDAFAEDRDPVFTGE
ncbi:enoyl-CoA hydratase/isomerase family protein [Halospeciosus flavus]|uniref:Enoyl-CoA hydratase/isomerase family protein n=1 Tax=Halospeciosus flavus TaxID=3032283 RepID=A0ABD5Z427_9EURY|nr:enoyl-CoA hydratase/isomerase family protein [Halospeciosus flavus]